MGKKKMDRLYVKMSQLSTESSGGGQREATNSSVKNAVGPLTWPLLSE